MFFERKENFHLLEIFNVSKSLLFRTFQQFLSSYELKACVNMDLKIQEGIC